MQAGPELNQEQIAALVVASVNHLPHRDDLVIGKTDQGCCPVCCACCFVLKQMIDANVIDHIISFSRIGHDEYDWWVDGKLDRRWLDAAWNLYPCDHGVVITRDGESTAQ